MNTTTPTQTNIPKSIIELLRINELSEGKQEEMVNRIGEIIYELVLIRALKTLENNESDLLEYEELANKEETEPDDLFAFFFSKIPNFAQIVAEESERVRKTSEEALEKIK